MDSYALFWINKQWQHEVNKGLRRGLYRSALQRKAGTDLSSVPASLNLRLHPPTADFTPLRPRKTLA